MKDRNDRVRKDMQKVIQNKNYDKIKSLALDGFKHW